MKLKFLLLLVVPIATVVSKANAQVYGTWTGTPSATHWSYAPGVGSDTRTATPPTSQSLIAPTFVAAPPSGNVRALITGATGATGSIKVENNIFTVVANNGNSPHKISAYNIGSTTALNSLFFTLHVPNSPVNATNGLIILGIANSSAGVNTDNNQIAGGDIPGLFTAIQLSIGTNLVTARYRGPLSGGSHAYTSLTPTLAKATDLKFEIYSNNSTVSETYNRGGAPINIGSGIFHIYVNGTQLQTSGGTLNLPFSGELTAGTILNSFVFTAANSTTPSNSALTFDISDIKVGSGVSVLPVALTNFDAKKLGSSVKLDWSTSSEQNNQYFELFRSKDAEGNFVSINKTQGNGTTPSAQKYSFTDFNPHAGINYYKLAQVDNDGKLGGSWLTSVTVAGTNETLKAYVDAQKQLKLSYYAENKTAATVEISDMSGKKVAAKKLLLEKDNNDISVDLAKLSTGIYLVTITTSGNQNTAKIVIK